MKTGLLSLLALFSDGTIHLPGSRAHRSVPARDFQKRDRKPGLPVANYRHVALLLCICRSIWGQSKNF